MTDPTEVAKIAGGLTKAAKRAICSLDRQQYADWDAVFRQRRQRIAAHAAGLTEPYREGPVTMWCYIRLTPLGLAVREHLERKP